MQGELKLIPAPYKKIETKLTPAKGLDIGGGKNETFSTHVYGGVLGIILDGRGRQPFILSKDPENRVNDLKVWSRATFEYPDREVS